MTKFSAASTFEIKASRAHMHQTTCKVAPEGHVKKLNCVLNLILYGHANGSFVLHSKKVVKIVMILFNFYQVEEKCSILLQ